MYTSVENIGHSWIDFPSPSDNAVVVYFSGCSHACYGCQNEELQIYAEHTEIKTFFTYLERELLKQRTDCIVLSGGDPLFNLNLNITHKIIEVMKGCRICVYTGYGPTEAQERFRIVPNYIKCGKFQPTLFQKSFKTDTEMQFASKNQELFDSEWKQLSQNGHLFF